MDSHQEKRTVLLMFCHWTQSGKASEKITVFSKPKLTGSSKINVDVNKRHHFICGALFLAVCGSLVPLCNAGAGTRKRPKDHFSEFDSLLTVLALLLSIAGIFMCVWRTCCAHHAYFSILDQRKFQQQALSGNAV